MRLRNKGIVGGKSLSDMLRQYAKRLLANGCEGGQINSSVENIVSSRAGGSAMAVLDNGGTFVTGRLDAFGWV